MLNQEEKNVLAHLQNWTYDTRPQGLKVVSLGTETLRVLETDNAKRERLANLAAFDTEPPFYIEFEGLPSDVGIRKQAAFALLASLRRAMNHHSEGISMVFNYRGEALLHGLWYLPEDWQLRLQLFVDLDEMVPFLETPPKQIQHLASYGRNTLAVLNAGPTEIDRLARVTMMLIEQGHTHLAINLDHNAPWDEAHFPIIQRQWRQILENTHGDLASGRLVISECRRICGDEEFFCRPGLKRIFVDAEGALWPCHRFYQTRTAADTPIGNLDQGVLEYDNQAFHLFNTLDMQDCNECVHQSSCNNRCLWSNDARNGRFYQTSGSVCAYEKAVREAIAAERTSVLKNPGTHSAIYDFMPVMCSQ